MSKKGDSRGAGKKGVKPGTNKTTGKANKPATPGANQSHPGKPVKAAAESTRIPTARASRSGARVPPVRSRSAATEWTKRLLIYAQLMRLHKPIGILLLLWPALWSLWLAAGGFPRWDLIIIFTLGVVLMRSAGCLINDYADRNIDGHVDRTRERPLVTGAVSTRETLALCVVLCLLAFALVLLTNSLTVQLAFGGLFLAALYPFMKRYTHMPQVVLGAAFAWSIPMAFAAQRGALSQELWLIYLAVVLWTVVYDTFYAMVDRDDDRRIGVKSTAILFGEQDRMITGFLQALTIYALVLVGGRFELGIVYYLSLVVVAGLFVYQQYLIRFRERAACFKAFLNNHWVGLMIFLGISLDLAFNTAH